MDKSVNKRMPLIKQTIDIKVCNLAYVASLVGYY